MSFIIRFILILFVLLNCKEVFGQKTNYYFDDKIYVINDTIYAACAKKNSETRIRLILAPNSEKPIIPFNPNSEYYGGSFYEGLTWAIGLDYFLFERRSKFGPQATMVIRNIYFFKRSGLELLNNSNYPKTFSTKMSTGYGNLGTENLGNPKKYSKDCDLAISNSNQVYFLVNTNNGIKVGLHQSDYWKKVSFKDINDHEAEDQWKILDTLQFDVQDAFRSFIVDENLYVLSPEGIFTVPLDDLSAGYKIAEILPDTEKKPIWIIDLTGRKVYVHQVEGVNVIGDTSVDFLLLSDVPGMEQRVKEVLKMKLG